MRHLFSVAIVMALVISDFAVAGEDGFDPSLCSAGFSDVRQALRNRIGAAKASSLEHRSGTGERWPMDGSDAADPITGVSYDEFFSGVTGGKTVEHILMDRKASGKSTHVADLFGSAVFHHDPAQVDSLTGIRFKRLDPDHLPQHYPNPKWAEIEGNLYERKTWNRIDQRIASESMGSFDLIILRPGKAQYVAPDIRSGELTRSGFTQLNFGLLNRAYERLNSDGGQILMQISPYREGDSIIAWLESLKGRGIDVTISGNGTTAKITKLPSSPRSLPKRSLEGD